MELTSKSNRTVTKLITLSSKNFGQLTLRIARLHRQGFFFESGFAIRVCEQHHFGEICHDDFLKKLK
jgi:hypothetical protein